MSDLDAENTETKVWLDFSLACKYIDKDKFEGLKLQSDEVGKLLNFMMNNPDKFRQGHSSQQANCVLFY